MQLTLIAMTAIAISLDGFMAGMVYGVRRVRVPYASILVIALTTVGVLFVSISAGDLLGHFLSDRTAHLLGALILMGIGACGVVRVYTATAPAYSQQAPHTIVAWRLRPLGIVIQILREPLAADLDRSGSISGGEAVLLGAALALDAVGAGFGAGLAGLQVPALLLCAGACNFCFVWAGVLAGERTDLAGRAPRLGLVPGLVLMLVGLLRLLVF